MSSNYYKDDPVQGNIDLDEYFITENKLIEEFIGDNRIFGWGSNFTGNALQTPDGGHRSSPVQVGSSTNWKSISMGSSVLAIKNDGTLWSWGINRDQFVPYGNLGLGDVLHRSSPVQVGTFTDWKNVWGCYMSSMGIRTTGQIYAWGYNIDAHLGLGNFTSVSTPVQIGTATDWKILSPGLMHHAAIKNDGSLWIWGVNDIGQLGKNSAGVYFTSTPVQVGSLKNWRQVSCGGEDFNGCTAAIKTDGTLWTWGHNSYGQLGLNDLVHRSSPVQVGSSTDWKYVKAVGYRALAIKNDGTLWAWGASGGGSLGLGDAVTDRSSPTQVGSLTNWKSINIQIRAVHALKTDGTLWGWGDQDGAGSVGNGNATINMVSPVQIGNLRTWTKLSEGYGTQIAAAPVVGALRTEEY